MEYDVASSRWWSGWIGSSLLRIASATSRCTGDTNHRWQGTLPVSVK